MDLDMTGYYDIVLGLIPVVLTGMTGALLAVGLTLATAVSVSSVFAMGLIGHAMFVRGPVDDTAPQDAAPDGVGYGTAD